MKTYSVLVLAIFYFTTTKAQYKTMFPSDSITWVHTITIIDAAVNKEFKYTGNKNIVQGNECYIISSQYDQIEYCIYEDLENGKTWQYYINSFNEDTIKYLLMDLNLSFNDSVIYNHGYSFLQDTTYIHVSKIDTTHNRKIIEFKSPRNYLAWGLPLRYIEGIGSNFGLIDFDSYDQVLCKLYYEDKLVYALDTFNFTCPTWTDINEYEFAKSFSIYPNPVQSVLHISLKKGTAFPCPIYFYDLSGKLLLHKNLTEQITPIYLSHLSTQIIFYKLMLDDHVFNGKILKQ